MTDVVPTAAAWEETQSMEQDLARAKEVIAGEVPEIAPTPEVHLTLPRGIYDNGRWHASCEVRELTGVDEEALAKVRKVEDTFDAMLTRGVVRIGDFGIAQMDIGESRGWLNKLLIGEREMLFLAIAKATYGDVREYPVKCQVCNLDQTLTVAISEDFKPKEIPDIRERSFSFTTSKGQQIKYRLATGDDQAEIMRKEGASVAEMNTIMLSNCILEVDGTIVVDPPGFARGLPMRDRQKLLREMLIRQPNVDLAVRYECSGCGEGQLVNFGWLDFFRP